MDGDVQFWIYPINPDNVRGYRFVEQDEGASGETSAETLYAGILEGSHGDQPSDWALSTGYKAMRPGDLVWVYEAGRRKEIVALARVLRVHRDYQDWWAASLLWDIEATKALRDRPIPRGDNWRVIEHVSRANGKTRRMLRSWLKDHEITSKPLDADDDTPLSDADARQRVLAEVVRRQGQGKFRDDLLSSYNRRCAVTGCRAVEVLEAAHIHPYRGPDTNRVTNGLLLRADIHTLFDLGLIAVDDRGRVCVSRRLARTEYATYAGRRLRLPTRKRDRPSKRQLKWHRKQFTP